MYGINGLMALISTINYAKSKNLIVLLDAKRNDISTTATAYSSGYLGKVKLGDHYKGIFEMDAITINPYMRSDGIYPFLQDVKEYKKGVFIVVKTSNKSSFEIQDLKLENEQCKFYEYIAKLVDHWSMESIGSRGYSDVRAVVGATFPSKAK